MADEHWVATEPSPRHVRAVFEGVDAQGETPGDLFIPDNAKERPG